MSEKFDEKNIGEAQLTQEATRGSISDELPADNADHLQRRLGNRQIQLIAIGGSSKFTVPGKPVPANTATSRISYSSPFLFKTF
jgi:hypothetical protein